MTKIEVEVLVQCVLGCTIAPRLKSLTRVSVLFFQTTPCLSHSNTNRFAELTQTFPLTCWVHSVRGVYVLSFCFID